MKKLVLMWRWWWWWVFSVLQIWVVFFSTEERVGKWIIWHEAVDWPLEPLTDRNPASISFSVLLLFYVLRAVCGVASVQPVVNVLAPMPQPSPAHLPPPPILPLHPSLAVPTIGETNSPQQQTAPHPQQQQPHPPSPEQNGILDWLRKLRLHKYYPVFKQLTMEEVQWKNTTSSSLGMCKDIWSSVCC